MPFNFAQSLKTYSSYSMWLWSSVYHIHRVSNRRSIVLAIFHCRQIYNIGLNTEKSFSRLEIENDVSYLVDFSGLMIIPNYSTTIFLFMRACVFECRSVLLRCHFKGDYLPHIWHSRIMLTNVHLANLFQIKKISRTI